MRLDSSAALQEQMPGLVLTQIMEQASKTPALFDAYFDYWHEVGNVGKNAKNPHHKNDYANLEAVMAVVKPLMKKHGLVLLQVPGYIRDGNQVLQSALMHKPSKEVWNFHMEIPLGEKRTAQSTGSGLTYARRYFTLTISGMCPVDDDGEAAAEEVEEEPEPAVEDSGKLIAVMQAFKGKGPAAAKEFTDKFKDSASAGGPATATEFIRLRGVIKNAK